MGGFLGIGKSDAERQLEYQRQKAREEAERARREAEIRQAEKVAKKGQETANIKIGGTSELLEEDTKKTDKRTTPALTPESSLGLGNLKGKKTGVQL